MRRLWAAKEVKFQVIVIVQMPILTGFERYRIRVRFARQPLHDVAEACDVSKGGKVSRRVEPVARCRPLKVAKDRYPFQDRLLVRFLLLPPGRRPNGPEPSYPQIFARQ